MNNQENQQVEKFRKDYQPAPFLIRETELTFELHESETLVHSKLSFYQNEEAERAQPLVLNGESLELLSIELDGVYLPRSSYRLNDKTLEIDDLPKQFTLKTTTKIDPKANSSLEGLYTSSGKFTTQCEAEGFRKITYYLDRPDVMSKFTTKLIARKDKYPYLLSNGNPVDEGELDNGLHYAVWHDPFPKPSYLFALVAGDFDVLSDDYRTKSGHVVALNIYVDKGNLKQCHHAMESLKKSMQWDEDTYGLEYDLNIYNIVAVGDFNMGAMENKGLNIFNTCYVLADKKTATDSDFEGVESVIAHEYFHNWTGNRVTCRDWFQLSLKEGLTVYRDQEFSSDMNSRAIKRVEDVKVIKTLQFAEDAGPMAHPIRPDSYIEMNNFYTVTVYNKGAEVIRMMETILSTEGFKKGMSLYFNRHDGQAVTCEDFVRAMEDANQADLALFRNWYRQAGTPEVRVQQEWNQSDKRLTLHFSQRCPTTPNQPHKELFMIPIRFALFTEQGQSLDLAKHLQEHDQCVAHPDGYVLLMGSQDEKLVFENIESPVIPSLLRGFSAPVKMLLETSDNELATLIAYDDDSYSKWNAAQTLITGTLAAMMEALKTNQEARVPEVLIEAFKTALTDEKLDPALKALILTMPGLDYLVEQFEEIDLDALVDVRRLLIHELANSLKSDLLAVYEQSLLNAISKDDQAERRLANACMELLAGLKLPETFELVEKHYNNAKLMSLLFPALKALIHQSHENAQSFIDDFYERYQDYPLVLDKWFAVQACNPDDRVIDNIKELIQHADFNLKNPNKVRSLFGSFARMNLVQFHRKDGKGYQLIGDYIIKLNAINPQIAARLTTSFNRWRQYDRTRQSLMQAQLKRLVNLDGVSPDVYEIASKALE